MTEVTRAVPTEADLAWAEANGWNIELRPDFSVRFYRSAPLPASPHARLCVFTCPHGGWWSGYLGRSGGLILDNYLPPNSTARKACRAAWRFHVNKVAV